MSIGIGIAAAGLLLSIIGSIANLFYKMGHHSARLDKLQSDAIKLDLIDNHGVRLNSLEAWRADVRRDMHEISDKMTQVITEIHGVKTLIEERTERRRLERPEQSIWQERTK